MASIETTDPFFTLLTDALRAGPGSPEWREAVSRLRAGEDVLDEHRLLIEAREALESGKEYGSVRPGPGFTRKVMSGIEQEQPASARSHRFPTATVIALLSALVVLVVLGVVAYQLYPRGEVTPGSKAADELAATFFPNEVLSSNFNGSIPMVWRTIGTLPLQSTGGLRPGTQQVQGGTYVGGGVVTNDPLSADQPFGVQVELRATKPGQDLVAQVFVSNSADFSPDRATSPHELVWSLHGRQEQVVVDGKVEAQRELAAQAPPGLTVRVVVNRELAVVEVGGKRLWAGPNGLGSSARYVGVRFIRTGAEPADVSIQSVRINRG